jgi:uncharacterized membrane protein
MENKNLQSNDDLLKEIKKEVKSVNRLLLCVLLMMLLLIVMFMATTVLKNNKPVTVTADYYRIESKDGIMDTILESTTKEIQTLEE